MDGACLDELGALLGGAGVGAVEVCRDADEGGADGKLARDDEAEEEEGDDGGEDNGDARGKALEDVVGVPVSLASQCKG